MVWCAGRPQCCFFHILLQLNCGWRCWQCGWYDVFQLNIVLIRQWWWWWWWWFLWWRWEDVASMYLDIILLLLGTGDSTLRMNSLMYHYIHNYLSHHLLQRHCYHCHWHDHHHLVKCLYPELILICATLVFCLGLSHARRVAQIFWERGWKYFEISFYLCLCLYLSLLMFTCLILAHLAEVDYNLGHKHWT